VCWPMQFRLRLRSLLRRKVVEQELDEELRYHLERQIDIGIASGLAPEEARYAALRSMGGMTQNKEGCRDMRRMNFMDNLGRDVHYAVRNLRKNPGFTCLALLIMALGIGANTAVFSVVNAVLLKPLPYKDPDRIVTLSASWQKTGTHGQVSIPDFQDWHDQTTAFSAMAYYTDYDIAVTAGSSAEYAHVARVSPDFFQVFGVNTALGRLFDSQEEKPASAGAAVISYSYWQTHFAGHTSALGRTIRMNAKAVPIIGVLSAGFDFPDKTDIWCPANTIVSEDIARGAQNYLAVGRLKPEVTLGQAQSQLNVIALRLERQNPSTNKGKTVAATRLRDEMVRNVRVTLYLLLGSVALLLLIACANVANLLLARATVRTREIAVRVAIGAGRLRLLTQLMTESVVLSLLAGTLGIALAFWAERALVMLAATNLPRLTHTGLDERVLVFTFGVCVITSLIFGLAPALHASRLDVNDALKQGAARAVVGGSAGRTRAALVVIEIALSVVLVAAAALLIKSFVALQNVPLGYRPENVLVMKTSVPSSTLETAQRATRMYKTLLSELETLPGIVAVGATRIPPGHVGSWGPYWVNHKPEPGAATVSAPQAVYSIVAPSTFAALRIPLDRGRDFTASDTSDAPFTAVINEALARKAFPGQDPIGRSIICSFDSPTPMKIVGVVGDVRQYGPAREPWPEVYMPYEQHPRPSTALNIVVRTRNDPASLAEELRRKVHELSPEVPAKFTTMEASLAENMAAPRFRTLLFSVFAGIAVLLAMTGIYGVMAYVVSQRSNELGLRIALGASSADVLRLVLRQALGLTGIGIGIGTLLALGGTRLLTSMLFEVKATDPITYVWVSILLAMIALTASYFPARRAAKVDPLVTLRQE